jgi:tetrahydromethanopterin S-methyltransferase subunit G
MKAHSVEGKSHVPAMVLSREQFDDFNYMMRRLKNIEKTAG